MLARTSIFHISKGKIIVNLSNSAIKWLLNCQNIPSLLVIKIWIILWRSTMIRNITFITSVMIEWQSSGTVMRTVVTYSEGVFWQWDWNVVHWWVVWASVKNIKSLHLNFVIMQESLQILWEITRILTFWITGCLWARILKMERK